MPADCTSRTTDFTASFKPVYLGRLSSEVYRPHLLLLQLSSVHAPNPGSRCTLLVCLALFTGTDVMNTFRRSLLNFSDCG